MEKYIAFDCETGGLDTGVSSLLTVYFVVFDSTFKVLGELDLKIKPDKGQHYVVDMEAMAVNKIDLKAHDAVAITMSQAKSDLYNFLQVHNPDGKTKMIPVGHNIYFDEECIMANMMTRGNWHKFVSYRRLDTGVIFQFLKMAGLIPAGTMSSLGHMVDYFGITKSGELHEAKTDTIVTVKALKAMLKLIQRNNQ